MSITSYFLNKHFLIFHSVDDSFPELIDRMTNDSIFVLYDDYLMDLVFNDNDRQVIIHQIFELVHVDGKLKLIPVEDYSQLPYGLRFRLGIGD